MHTPRIVTSPRRDCPNESMSQSTTSPFRVRMMLMLSTFAAQFARKLGEHMA
jgi:hypothetical protein